MPGFDSQYKNRAITSPDFVPQSLGPSVGHVFVGAALRNESTAIARRGSDLFPNIVSTGIVTGKLPAATVPLTAGNSITLAGAIPGYVVDEADWATQISAYQGPAQPKIHMHTTKQRTTIVE